jgi:hypothetical protein
MSAGTIPTQEAIPSEPQEDPRWVAADIEAAKKRAAYHSQTLPPNLGIRPEVVVAAVDRTEAVTPTSNGSVNMPITWEQLLGGWLSDAPFFLMAALGVVATWLQSSAPVTTRGAVTVVILAILAGLTAVQRATGTDGLSLRLRSMGQLRSGK